MQGFGVLSFALCVIAMLALLAKLEGLGMWLFAASLGLLLVSLLFSILEIRLSANALDVALAAMERE
jgi:Protein of unknown function (DUF2721)